jgi:hypothetical protein
VGEEVRTIWGDFYFDECIRIKKFFNWRANFKIRIEDKESIFFVCEADFGSGGEHPFGLDTSHFGFADLESTGKGGAGEAAWDLVTDSVVGCSTDDLAKRAFAGINLSDFEAVGVRVLNCLFDLGHHYLVALDTYFLEAFDFDASKGKEVADFFERAGAKVEAFFEPSERNVHEIGRRKVHEVFFNRKSKKSRPSVVFIIR